MPPKKSSLIPFRGSYGPVTAPPSVYSAPPSVYLAPLIVSCSPLDAGVAEGTVGGAKDDFF